MSEKKKSFMRWIKSTKMFRWTKHGKNEQTKEDPINLTQSLKLESDCTESIEGHNGMGLECPSVVNDVKTAVDPHTTPILTDEFDLFVQLSNSPTSNVPATVVIPGGKHPSELDTGRKLQFRPDFDQRIEVSGRSSLVNEDIRRVMSVIDRKPSMPKPTSSRRDLARASFRSRSVRERGAAKRVQYPMITDPRRQDTHQPQSNTLNKVPSIDEGKDVNHAHGSHLYRVRSFKLTRKGVINLGDTFRTRSVACLTSNPTGNGTHTNFPLSQRNSSAGYSLHSPIAVLNDRFHFPRGSYNSDCAEMTMHSKAAKDSKISTDRRSDLESEQPIRIQIVGFPNVGKTALCRQMITSDFLGARMESMSEDTVERYVTVELDDQTWNIVLIDNFGEAGADELALVNSIRSQEKSGSATDSPSTQSTLQLLPNSKSSGSTLLKDVLVYLLVFAVDDARSYDYASKALQLLTKTSSQQIIMLVANKADLVRCRIVSTEKAKRLAHLHGCKYFEVSTAINHLVDELLVSIILQIKRLRSSRLSPTHLEVPDQTERRMSNLRLHGEAIVRYIRDKFDAKSCEDIQWA